MCQDMLIDHAVTIPMSLMWPGERWPVKIVPISINTVQHPLPSLARCLKLGCCVGRALETYPRGYASVLVVATGGLSHQLDGKRAGFINKDFDQLCLDKIVNDPRSADALFDRMTGRARRQPGRRVPQLDGDARRADRAGDAGASQLSHPDLQHRGGDHRSGERQHGGAPRRLES